MNFKCFGLSFPSIHLPFLFIFMFIKEETLAHKASSEHKKSEIHLII